MQIGHLEEEARKKSEEMKAIQQKLQEKEADMATLKQQISSQESLLKHQGENLHQKSDLLSNLANFNQQLITALEQNQEDRIKLKCYEIEVHFYQEYTKELHSLLFKVSIIILLRQNAFTSPDAT